MKRFSILLFSILLLFFAVGCSKDKGWKAQSVQAETPVGTDSVSGVSGSSEKRLP